MDIEEAFCLADNKLYTADEFKVFISQRHNKLNEPEDRNREQYTKFLVCPFCKLAKCEYIYDERHPHFKIPETAEHKDGCFLKKEEYTQAELKNNLKRGNVAFIERAINEFVSVYSGSESKARVSEFKRLPLKLATLPLRRSESGNLILYYGNVNVSVSGTENERGKELTLSSPLTGKAMYKITITDNVYRYMPEDVKEKLREDATRFVCFFGNFSIFGPREKDSDNDICLCTSLLRSSFLKML